VVLVAALGGCGKSPPTLAGGKPVTYWVEALRDPDARQRKTAAFKLGNAGPADPAVLPALLAALQDPDPVVRREVILSLVKFGPAAREAVPVLEGLGERDPDPEVRAAAAKGLERLRRDE
jgi:HEAT repeat protein